MNMKKSSLLGGRIAQLGCDLLELRAKQAGLELPSREEPEFQALVILVVARHGAKLEAEAQHQLDEERTNEIRG